MRVWRGWRESVERRVVGLVVVMVVVRMMRDVVVDGRDVDVECKRVRDRALTLLVVVVMVDRRRVHHRLGVDHERAHVGRCQRHPHGHAAIGRSVTLHIARGWEIVQWFLLDGHTATRHRVRATHHVTSAR